MLWPSARTGNTDDLIARAWMLWPFARSGAKRGRRVLFYVQGTENTVNTDVAGASPRLLAVGALNKESSQSRATSCIHPASLRTEQRRP